MSKNPYDKSVYNIGYLGEGKNIVGRKNRAYNIWTQILTRCYSINFQTNTPSYIGCSVDKRWHNFQVFAEWYDKNYIENFQLDKDILINENKIYGPDTCCFVPKEINVFFARYKPNRQTINTGVSIVNGRYYAKILGKVLGPYVTLEEARNKYLSEKKIRAIFLANTWKHLISNKVFETIINYNFDNK